MTTFDPIPLRVLFEGPSVDLAEHYCLKKHGLIQAAFDTDADFGLTNLGVSKFNRKEN